MASAKERPEALASLVEVTTAYRLHNDAVARRLPALDGLLERCKSTLALQVANNERADRLRREREGKA